MNVGGATKQPNLHSPHAACEGKDGTLSNSAVISLFQAPR